MYCGCTWYLVYTLNNHNNQAVFMRGMYAYNINTYDMDILNFLHEGMWNSENWFSVFIKCSPFLITEQ